MTPATPTKKEAALAISPKKETASTISKPASTPSIPLSQLNLNPNSNDDTTLEMELDQMPSDPTVNFHGNLSDFSNDSN